MKLLENVSQSDFRDPNWKPFFQYFEAYEKSQNSFFSYWFRIMRELRDRKPLVLAGLMHDSRNVCASVSGYLALIEHQYSEGQSGVRDDLVDRLLETLRELVSFLEELNACVMSERDGRKGDLWGGGQPNKAGQLTQ
jgi:hypothetical protein